MTEQSQMPLVGPPKRRGWREIVWLRPLTSSTHATLVVTRRGRFTSVVPANSPRTLSDYLAWPYDFREVDMRERLLALEQRLESFDSGYEFCVSLRLVYQVVRADRVALEIEDVQAELAHAVVQSLRASGRSFGVEQDTTFEEHLQEALIYGEALVQRLQSLGLALRRADVAVTLDEPTRAHAEALRSAMRERPLHFQVAVESLEPERSFDVHVGGAYRLTERRAHAGPSEATESAIHMAIARTLRRVGIAFSPGDYPNAAKAMAETLRKDVLLESELSTVHVQLLRPTVQIQPDRSMVHVPRPNPLGVPDTRPDSMMRRLRQGMPRPGRRPALVDMGESEKPPKAPMPALRRALPPPQPPADAANPTLPLDELPASSETIDGAYSPWTGSGSKSAMSPRPLPNQPEDEQDARAPWADLMDAANAATEDISWRDTPPPTPSRPAEPLPWGTAAMAQAEPPVAAEPEPDWPDFASSAFLSEPAEPLPWGTAAMAQAEPPVAAEPEPDWPDFASSAFLGEPAEPPAPWEGAAVEAEQQPAWPDLATPAFLGEPVDQLSGAPPETEDATTLIWPGLVGAPESDTTADTQAFSTNAFAEDLGFSLDWSGSESAPTAKNPPADRGFLFDWGEARAEPFSSAWAPAAESNTDDGIVTAHWDDQAAGLPEAPPFDSAPEEPASAGARPAAPELSPAPDPDQTRQHSEAADVVGQPTEDQPEQAQPSIEQEAPPWYTPTLHLDDQVPPDVAADRDYDSSHGMFGSAWAEPPAASAPADHPPPGTGEPSLEAHDAAWATEQAPLPTSELAFDTSIETADQLPVEMLDAAWVLRQAEPGSPAAPAGDPLSDMSDQLVLDAPGEEAPVDSAPAVDMPHDTSEQASSGVFDAANEEAPASSEPASVPEASDLSEPAQESGEAAAEVPADLVARMIGMIQSYGPAWFKMWSLELKERPERLPVVLGEVTADPVLLAQADDPRVQSALLRALAAYSSPATFSARLPSSAPLPSPAVAGQGNDAEDAVPDWLSLRVKWNGHGGST